MDRRMIKPNYLHRKKARKKLFTLQSPVKNWGYQIFLRLRLSGCFKNWVISLEFVKWTVSNQGLFQSPCFQKNSPPMSKRTKEVYSWEKIHNNTLDSETAASWRMGSHALKIGECFFKSPKYKMIFSTSKALFH